MLSTTWGTSSKAVTTDNEAEVMYKRALAGKEKT
jgi:hypothetical protein